ncbi:hypothetical protein F2Q69_00036102 [Brassica cretica]|uniref:Uncharacterized protein n=1 Tax=Brassica cretica TaxID=69181 RepID=A0A8S9SFQ3_BRACR|nr:hypothetical protein F2Q69_00036102 [Brassica cretica]
MANGSLLLGDSKAVRCSVTGVLLTPGKATSASSVMANGSLFLGDSKAVRCSVTGVLPPSKFDF